MTDYQNLVRPSRLYPVLLLERWFDHRSRLFLWRLVKISLGLLGFFLVLTVLGRGAALPSSLSLLSLSAVLAERLVGASLVLLAVWLVLLMLDIYFRDYYYGSIVTNEYRSADIFTFTVGRILVETPIGDLTAGVLGSATGRRLLARCGINQSAAEKFLRHRREPIGPPLPAKPNQVLRLGDLLERLLAEDQELVEFLARAEITKEDFLAAARWVVLEIERRASSERWWSRAALQAKTPLAADWGYGGTFVLDRYGRDLLDDPQARPAAGPLLTDVSSVEQLKTILLRSQEANILLVGPPGAARLSLLWQLAREINARLTPRPLWNKRLLVFKSVLLLADGKDKAGLESLLITMLNEASRAGNVILIIDDLPTLLRGAEGLGVEADALLDPYLESTTLPMIALANSEHFNRDLVGRTGLMRRFEVVMLADLGDQELLATLEEAALALEERQPVQFTYPALTVLGQSAGQYFQTQSRVDQALDLLVEIVPWASGRGEPRITKSLAWEFVKSKTAIPLGAVTLAERRNLLQLTAQLKKRIIGQTAALEAVSNALRRNRTAVRNPRRPVGSFLFLGPTGVGKTETAKALAAVFFGAEELLTRFDMSEYQSPAALDRLIGGEGEAGTLSTALRQTPYGVLLMDEFEKSDYRVRDLFLQILDEGQFSDAAGRRLNARNLIIIATSNAAAAKIWELVRQGIDPANQREELIDQLIRDGIFRPELLNRFDAIVIFHPLTQEELRAVARLLLGRLAARLAGQGINLVSSDALINVVVQRGANRAFGARPMLRFIQDEVERVIADHLLTGEIKSGATISFDEELTLKIKVQ